MSNGKLPETFSNGVISCSEGFFPELRKTMSDNIKKHHRFIEFPSSVLMESRLFRGANTRRLKSWNTGSAVSRAQCRQMTNCKQPRSQGLSYSRPLYRFSGREEMTSFATQNICQSEHAVLIRTEALNLVLSLQC